MAKAPLSPTDAQVEAEASASTPVLDAIDTSGGPHYVLDQMCDVLERARIDAQGRTDDLSIKWGHEAGEDEAEVRRFWVSQGETVTNSLTVDEAKAALDAIGAEG